MQMQLLYNKKICSTLQIWCGRKYLVKYFDMTTT